MRLIVWQHEFSDVAVVSTEFASGRNVQPLQKESDYFKRITVLYFYSLCSVCPTFVSVVAISAGGTSLLKATSAAL